MRLITAILLIFITTVSLWAEDTEKVLSAYEGRHFFLGFMENEVLNDYSSNPDLIQKVYMTSSTFSEVVMSVAGAAPTTYTINPSQIIEVDIPETMEVTESEVILDKTIEIMASEPITVYAFSSIALSSDAYTALPVSAWGREYVSINYPNDQYSVIEGMDEGQKWDRLKPRSGEFMIMAAYDNTTISFKPNGLTDKGKQTYREYSEVLNKGECYLVQANNHWGRGAQDLTGTIVRADKPVGFLSGHVRTAVPQFLDEDADSKDHLIEMLPPVDSWGREFVSVPFGVSSHGDMLRVTNYFPETIVSYENNSGTFEIFLDEPGEYEDVYLLKETTKWTSNKPVQIGQMMMRVNHVPESDIYYDPCLVILPGTDLFVQHIHFQTVGNYPGNPGQYTSQRITLVITEEALPTMKLDGRLITSTFLYRPLKKIGNDGLYSAVVSITDGTHTLSCDEGAFSGIIYGVGKHDSYAMALGSVLTNPFEADTLAPELTYTEDCGLIEISIWDPVDDATSGVDFIFVLKDSTHNYSWDIDEIGDISSTVTLRAEPIDYFEDGTFCVDIRDRKGNGQRFRYFYDGLDAEFDREIDFGITSAYTEYSRTFTFTNSGTDTIYIGSLSVENDARVTMSHTHTFPDSLYPGESFSVIVSFKPVDNAADLNAALVIGLDCERLYRVPILATVEYPALAVIGYDFGDRIVGSTTCDSVTIFNNGNVAITLYSLDITKTDPQFVIDTSGIFPITLDESDSLRMQVCFSPESRGDFFIWAEASNSGTITNQMVVKGRGIAPVVNPEIVDWKQRRIGTRNDTIIYLTNSGEAPCRLVFDQITAASDPEIITDDMKTVDILLNPGDSTEINTAFLPIDPIQYNAEVLFTMNWSTDPVSLQLIGEGTLPVIDTVQVIFADTYIFSQRDTNATIVKSLGNEILTIDSIVAFSGDISSFVIDYDALKNLKIDYASGSNELAIPISFTPDRTGYHEMLLEVTHDAAANYERKISYVLIAGPSVPVDTLDYNLDFETDGLPTACQSGILNFIIRNTGNVKLNLQSVSITDETFDAKLDPSFVMPTIIKPDTFLSVPILIDTESGEEGKLTIDIQMNDSLKESVTYTFSPVILPLTIFKTDSMKYTPNDTLSFAIGGTIPSGTIQDIDFATEIEVPMKHLYLLTDRADLILSSTSGTLSYPLNIEQSLERINISSKNKINISDSSDWKITFPVLGLLADKEFFDIRVRAFSDPCFKDDFVNMVGRITNICVLPLRMINFTESRIPEISINPNPVLEKIHVNIVLGHEESLNFAIFDTKGKKYSLLDNLNLKNGSHSLIFDIRTLPTGVYILSVTSSIMTKNTMFVIIQ
ncbi:MAG: choice-of-anchor D domain-containing protein [Candidatus Kapabacteria bacterium]|jgi:hypothetical protein|nr:choice-of-anchor D domain-containing protein [Candidatus Kapabacteria bacterium]